MVRSGKLWEGLGVVVSASATGVSVRVTATEEYAKFLQYGTRKMRARLIVPGENVLASIWRQHLERARDEAMKAWLSGRL